MKISYLPIIIDSLIKASNKIMEIDAQNINVEIKPDNSPVTLADKASSKILMNGLSQFGIKIISEEETIPLFESRKNEEYLWLVDPLDGTKEFLKKNDQFCICIALVKNNKSIFGFIASPTNKTILFGGGEIEPREIPFGEDDFMNEKWIVKQNTSKQNKTIAHSNAPFSELAIKFIAEVESKFGKVDFIRKGSALKFVDLVKSDADFYIRLAPTMEWDIAAGQAIYEAVGGEVVDFYTKKPLNYNKEVLKNPHFLAKIK